MFTVMDIIKFMNMIKVVIDFIVIIINMVIIIVIIVTAIVAIIMKIVNIFMVKLGFIRIAKFFHFYVFSKRIENKNV